jgi:hypothetical protein
MSEQQAEREMVLYALRPLPHQAFDPAMTMRFVSTALLLGGKICLQIAAEEKEIVWRLIDRGAGYSPDFLCEAVKMFFPSVDVGFSDELKVETRSLPFYREVIPHTFVAHYPFPLRYVNQIARGDPLVLLTRLMSTLEVGERLIYTVYVAAIDPSAAEKGRSLISKRDISPRTLTAEGITAAAFNALFNVRRDAYVPDLQKVAEEKLAQEQLARCFVLIQADSPSEERCHLIGGLSTICLLQTSSFQPWSNCLVPVDDFMPAQAITSDEADIASSTLKHIERWGLDEDKRWRDFALILCPDEIAALWHFL